MGLRADRRGDRASAAVPRRCRAHASGDDFRGGGLRGGGCPPRGRLGGPDTGADPAGTLGQRHGRPVRPSSPGERVRSDGVRPSRPRDGLLRGLHGDPMPEQSDLGVLERLLEQYHEPPRRPAGPVRGDDGLRCEHAGPPHVRRRGRRVQRLQRHLALPGRRLDQSHRDQPRGPDAPRVLEHGIRPRAGGERVGALRRRRAGGRRRERYVDLGGLGRLGLPLHLRVAPDVLQRPDGVRPARGGDRSLRLRLRLHHPQRDLGALLGPVVAGEPAQPNPRVPGTPPP